jgi:flagellum-specific peptidoglycan hydrolase FlgJ
MTNYLYPFIVLLLIGCSASKPKIQTTKKPTTIVKTSPSKKPISPEEKIIIDESKKSEELVATSKVKVTPEIVQGYINKYKNIAMQNMQNHGIPASISLAQAILESGAGTGTLCRVANNHFGIKCHKEWKGEFVRHDDDAAQECFRKYEFPEESYKDYSFFLTSRPWYAPLFKLEKNDYKGWARGLKKAGYATDIKYPEKLIGLIERYELHQFDAEVLGTTFMSKQDIHQITKDPNPSKDIVAEITHEVQQGETLYFISKKYNVSIETLKSKNNLIDNSISIGQILIIK